MDVIQTTLYIYVSVYLYIYLYMYYQFSIDVMSINLAVFCTSMKLADRYINAKLEGKYKGNVYVYVYISSCVCTYVNLHVHISTWKIEIENLTSIYPLRKLKLKKLHILYTSICIFEIHIRICAKYLKPNFTICAYCRVDIQCLIVQSIDKLKTKNKKQQ